jgi:tetratricopeptide (TPR) repeat protein
MGYLAYLLILVGGQLLTGLGLSWEQIAVAAVVAWALHRWAPDPYLFLKFLRKVSRLKSEIRQNPANVTARRDLAQIFLTKRRPARAAELLAEARARDGESAELALLHGKALLLAGRFEAALAPLVAAAEKNDRLFYGEAYLLAGRALVELGRAPEAEDAFQRYLAIHHSSVEGRVRLALARRMQSDADGARHMTREAISTYSDAPRFRRRVELRWYLRARLMTLGLA